MSTRIQADAAALRRALFRWYEPRRSVFPWRRTSSAYRILVSEIMLQQTQVSRVEPAYRAFVRRFPTASALARAPVGEVLQAWSGLGYNRRARALHQAARVVVQEHGGRLPRTVDGLRALPGVGPYTASAVAAIAFAVPVAAIDVNVRRVVARVALGVDAANAVEADVADAAERLLAPRRPGDWNQAIMDLGRGVCTPRAPRCDVCPLERWCLFAANDAPVAPPTRRQSRFVGSVREVRGAVVRELAGAPEHVCTVGVLRTRLNDSGIGTGLLPEAIGALADEGMIVASQAARDGASRAKVRLAP